MYQDNEKKFVAVLNKKIPLPQLLNALGHMSVGLGGQIEGYPDATRFYSYTDADNGIHPGISHYPFIVLSAKNSNQIRTCRQQALELGIPYTDFTHTMLGASAEEQLGKTKATKEEELEYFGLCLFGESEQLNGLTKKFSLFKAS